MKTLSKMNHVGHSQWALLVVDSKGRATVDTSDAFQNYRNLWFSDDIIKEACSVTLAAVSQLKERKRQELEQNGGQLKEDPAEGEGATEEYDFEDDAEHEDDEGGLDSPKAERSQESPSIPKHMTHSSPPIPPYPFSPTTPRARKRSLQVSKTPLIKKRRRSSVNSKAAAVPVQRSDSTSGESNAVTNPQGITYRPLLISDEEAVTTFFETRFRQMQQLTCKVVAKAWIKVIEPKKQSHFPYNRGEESKPSWWPAGARHKEPDHLMKPGMLLFAAICDSS